MILELLVAALATAVFVLAYEFHTFQTTFKNGQKPENPELDKVTTYLKQFENPAVESKPVEKSVESKPVELIRVGVIVSKLETVGSRPLLALPAPNKVSGRKGVFDMESFVNGT